MPNAIMTVEQIIKDIDTTIIECMPAAISKTQSFAASLTLAKGINTLRQAMNTPDIRKTVESMMNTKIGFMTDRTPEAIKKSKNPVAPYTYDEIRECCIEAMLKGYRITNNEFNVIAGNFYPALNGKYRQIIEYPGLTDFQYTTTPPIFDTEMRINYGKPEQTQIAKVQCYANWKLNGAKQSIGYSRDDEDRLIFKIKVNSFMGDDGVIGKAKSKLFSRVLDRIMGKVTPESTDIYEIDGPTGAAPEPPSEPESLKEKVKTKKAEVEPPLDKF